MRGSPDASSVLIVDKDLGFLSWLGDLFMEAGYRALPALTCTHAISLVKKFKLDIDVLVVDEELPGISGLIGVLRSPQRPLKIVVIRDSGATATKDIPSHATLDRPLAWEPISRADWLNRVLTVLKRAEKKAVG